MENKHEEERVVIFLDKDGTLGRKKIGEREFRLFPGVKEFLESLGAKEWIRCVATMACEEGRDHLSSIETLYDFYFGPEKIGVESYARHFTTAPYLLYPPEKNIAVARLLISPSQPSALKSVMVGDYGEKRTVASNPETPLIIVSRRVIQGEWTLVSSVLDQLICAGSRPHERFEAMIDGKHNGTWISPESMNYSLERGGQGERWIYCP